MMTCLPCLWNRTTVSNPWQSSRLLPTGHALGWQGAGSREQGVHSIIGLVCALAVLSVPNASRGTDLHAQGG